MEKNFNNFPPFFDFNMLQQMSDTYNSNMCNSNMSNDFNDSFKENLFNPIMQYEQGYYYYKFLCQQMDYKIKCKEYDKLCNTNHNAEKPPRRVE